jgi:hypothetical protein
MGMVGGYGKTVSVTKTIAAAGNYTANDVLSNSATNGAGTDWDFLDCARSGGLSFEIRGVRFYCSAGGVALTPRLHLFTVAPTTSEMDDNAAFNLTTADRTGYKGYIDPLAAFADMGDFAYAQNDDLAKQITTENGDKGIYGILETKTDETGESANMTITVELEIIQF